jgi:hypothetical protein
MTTLLNNCMSRPIIDIGNCVGECGEDDGCVVDITFLEYVQVIGVCMMKVEVEVDAQNIKEFTQM